jgi:hypothetical protein
LHRKLTAIFAAACSACVVLGAAHTAEAKTAHKPRHHATHHRGVSKKHGHSSKGVKKAPAAEAVNPTPPAPPVADDPASRAVQEYYAKYGLPGAYEPHALQRMLLMAGYDIGAVDGRIGAATAERGLRPLLLAHPGKFRGICPDTGAAPLTTDQLVALAPAIYRRVGQTGILELQAEPERLVMIVRATGSRHVMDGRTMVQGEMILRARDGREALIVDKPDGSYAMELMTRDQWKARVDAGEKIHRAEFNSGGLNYGRGGRAYQAARPPWNPYPGSALPGFSGGTAYELAIADELLNTKNGGLSKSFGDSAGNRSWIRIDTRDPEIVRGRGGFGIHVDGKTVGDVPNDGTAGCLGVREEYGAAFFAFIKALPEAQRPSHIIVAPPADFGLSVQQAIERAFNEFFSIPRKAVQEIDRLFQPKPR